MAFVPLGHRIPNELLKEIVIQAQLRRYNACVDPNQLSLVCCYWAQIIRPIRWQIVTIASRKRLQSLAILLEKSSQDLKFSTRLKHLGQIIDQIFVECDFNPNRSQPPWAHMVHQTLKPLLPVASITGTLYIDT